MKRIDIILCVETLTSEQHSENCCCKTCFILGLRVSSNERRLLQGVLQSNTKKKNKEKFTM